MTPVPLIWIAAASISILWRSTAGEMENVVGTVRLVEREMVRPKVKASTVFPVCFWFSGRYQGMKLNSFRCRLEYCSAGFCSSGSDPSPTPNAEKRQLPQPGQVRQQLCPAGMTACPVQPKGFEVSLLQFPYRDSDPYSYYIHTVYQCVVRSGIMRRLSRKSERGWNAFWNRLYDFAPCGYRLMR